MEVVPQAIEYSTSSKMGTIFKNVDLFKLGTVWKFHNFCITHILREIKFWDSRSAKSAISPHLEVFDFYDFLHFLKAEIYQMNKIRSP